MQAFVHGYRENGQQSDSTEMMQLKACKATVLFYENTILKPFLICTSQTIVLEEIS